MQRPSSSRQLKRPLLAPARAPLRRRSPNPRQLRTSQQPTAHSRQFPLNVGRASSPKPPRRAPTPRALGGGEQGLPCPVCNTPAGRGGVGLARRGSSSRDGAIAPPTGPAPWADLCATSARVGSLFASHEKLDPQEPPEPSRGQDIESSPFEEALDLRATSEGGVVR